MNESGKTAGMFLLLLLQKSMIHALLVQPTHWKTCACSVLTHSCCLCHSMMHHDILHKLIHFESQIA